MNKLLILLLFAVAPLQMFSQVRNHLVTFTNNGEKFTLILNGEKQNPFPVSKVRVEDLNLKKYKVTILFENKKIKTHNTDLTFFSTNNECVFALNPHGKKYSMDYVTSTPINPDLVPKEEETPPITPPSTEYKYDDNNSSYDNSNNSSTPTTPTNGSSDISIKTNKGSLGVGTSGVSINTNGVKTTIDPINKSTTNTVKVLGSEISMNKTLKTSGCKSPMSTLDFNESKIVVSKQETDSTRLIESLKILNDNCLKTSQVEEILTMYKTDLYKLRFSKKAYYKTSDINNFDRLEDNFSSEEGKKDLKNFIKNPN